MCKSVLVVNTPQGCTECPLSAGTGVYNANICRAMEKHSVNMDSGKVPGWCPLRKLPEKKELTYDIWEYDLLAKTWNDCIDAVGGDIE